jgi:hypothetical protein
MDPLTETEYSNSYGGNTDDPYNPTSEIYVDDHTIKQLNDVISRTRSMLTGGRSEGYYSNPVSNRSGTVYFTSDMNSEKPIKYHNNYQEYSDSSNIFTATD